eukprot:jgi/Bigna1/82945/fgenesh1_pg.99_\
MAGERAVTSRVSLESGEAHGHAAGGAPNPIQRSTPAPRLEGLIQRKHPLLPSMQSAIPGIVTSRSSKVKRRRVFPLEQCVHADSSMPSSIQSHKQSKLQELVRVCLTPAGHNTDTEANDLGGASPSEVQDSKFVIRVQLQHPNRTQRPRQLDQAQAIRPGDNVKFTIKILQSAVRESRNLFQSPDCCKW